MTRFPAETRSGAGPAAIHGGGGGGLTCPRHGTEDLAFAPVGRARNTATPASTLNTSTIQTCFGMTVGYSS